MIIKLLLAAAFAAPAPALAADSATKAELSTTTVANANQRLSARCSRPSFGVDALLADQSLRNDLETLSLKEAQDLVHYSACLTLQGSAGGCPSLAGLGHGFDGGVAACQALATHDRFVFATQRGGDAAGACRDMFAVEGVRGPRVEKGCAAVIAAVKAGNPSAACPTLKLEKLVGPEESCEDLLSSWSGVPKDCARIKDAAARRTCESRAGLVAGLRDPAQCASSPSCSVLAAKSPGACEGLRARFSRALCARVAKTLGDERLRLARVEELRRQSEKQVQERAAKADESAAAAAAEVQTKAEASRKLEAAAKAKISKQVKPQFRKGEPMQVVPADVAEILKAVEEGRPMPPPKPKKEVKAEPAE